MSMLKKPRGSAILLIGLYVLIASMSNAARAGGWVTFDDQTPQRLVADVDVGALDTQEKDYAWGDVDLDGDIDLVCVRKQPFTTPGRRENVLFMNEGMSDGHAINGVLVDRTDEFAVMSDVPGDLGFKTPTNDRDVVLVDVNNDGWLDMVTAVTLSDGAPKHISHPRVYINLGADGGVWQGFRFENDRIPVLGVLPDKSIYAPRFCAVAAGDVDNDGDVDLYFADYDALGPPPFGVDLEDLLLINVGAGVFEDQTAARMTPQMIESNFAMAAAIHDMNNDGAADVVKDTTGAGPEYVGIIYNDSENPGFFDHLDEVYDVSPYHVTVGNLNNDEWMDLVITDDGDDVFLLNEGVGGDGNATWSQFSFLLQQGVPESGLGGNSVIVDIDNDGFNDVFIADVDVDQNTCDDNVSHLYRNLGNVPTVTLQEVDGPMPWTPVGVHDVAIFDIDGDGWKDMVVGRCTGTEVWMQVDGIVPFIVHGALDVSFADHAFGGYIDPLAESNNGVLLNLGRDELTIVFSEPVVDVGGTELTVNAFTVTQTGDEDPPQITTFEMLDAVTAHLTIDRIWTLQEWLTVTVAAQDIAGNALPNLGDLGPGVDEADRIDVGFLPADVNQNGTVSPLDLLVWRQLMADLFSPEPDGVPDHGVHADFIDTSRDSAVSPFDLLRFRQLVNGLLPSTRVWAGETMNHPRP